MPSDSSINPPSANSPPNRPTSTRQNKGELKLPAGDERRTKIIEGKRSGIPIEQLIQTGDRPTLKALKYEQINRSTTIFRSKSESTWEQFLNMLRSANKAIVTFFSHSATEEPKIELEDFQESDASNPHEKDEEVKPHT
jgi:hypothetical protein